MLAWQVARAAGLRGVRGEGGGGGAHKQGTPCTRAHPGVLHAALLLLGDLKVQQRDAGDAHVHRPAGQVLASGGRALELLQCHLRRLRACVRRGHAT